jgi:shikimate kinase
MKIEQNIYIVGPMGSGKTSIGKRLSCILKTDFFDSDMEIISQTGVSIDHIFDVEGEAGFRKREIKIIQELCQRKGIVLSTGGGVVLADENQEQFKNGIVIYLYADIDVLVSRVKNSKNRPLLKDNAAKNLQRIIEQREPIYQKVANININTTGKKIYVIIKEIKQALKIINES